MARAIRKEPFPSKRLFPATSHVSNPKNDLLSLHPAALAGSILGPRPQQAHAAAEDAEPETAERRESLAASPAPTRPAAPNAA